MTRRQTIALGSTIAAFVAASCKGPTSPETSGVAANTTPAPIAAPPSRPVPPPAASVTAVAPVRPKPPPPRPAGPIAGAPGTNIGDKVAQFSAPLFHLTPRGEKVTTFDSHESARTTVYVFIGTRCPASHAYVQRHLALERRYIEKGVRFVYVYPNVDEQPKVKRTFHEEGGYVGGLIDDQGGRIARLFGATRTSEIVVVSKKGHLIYRGPVDDSRKEDQVKERFFAAALDEHLAGKRVTKPWSQVFA